MGQLTNMTYLDLSGNSLSGTLPTQVGLLSNLGSCVEPCGRFLWLDANQISGTLPSQLGLLTNLAGTLDLSGNRLSGTVPTELAALEKLQGRLHLHSNALDTQAAADGGCEERAPSSSGRPPGGNANGRAPRRSIVGAALATDDAEDTSSRAAVPSHLPKI